MNGQLVSWVEREASSYNELIFFVKRKLKLFKTELISYWKLYIF